MSSPTDDDPQRYVDRASDDVASGIERIVVAESLRYSIRAVVHQRKEIVRQRLGALIQTMRSNPSLSRSHEQAEHLSRVLQNRDREFEAALEGADDPASVYDEWLATLRSEFAKKGAEGLFDGIDTYPASPSPQG